MPRMQTDRPPIKIGVLALLTVLAVASLGWAATHALSESADLMRRVQEIRLFTQRADPYRDPDMTYPPSALVVFAPLVAPFSTHGLRLFWLGLNLASLVSLAVAIVAIWGRNWPAWLMAAFVLFTVASKPARLAIGMGQFALTPAALLLVAYLLAERRREVAAGLLVGIALAKPTLSLPFLAFLAVQRHHRAVVAALAFQAVATLAASAWLETSPALLVAEWLAQAREQQAKGLVDAPSVLTSIWRGSAPFSDLLSAAILTLTIGGLIVARRRNPRDLALFALLMSVVFTYHRPYDLVLMLPAIGALLDCAVRTRSRSLVAAVIGVAAIFILPADSRIIGPSTVYYERLFVAVSYALVAFSVYGLAKPADNQSANVSDMLGT
jgi:hypothetical protein